MLCCAHAVAAQSSDLHDPSMRCLFAANCTVKLLPICIEHCVVSLDVASCLEHCTWCLQSSYVACCIVCMTDRVIADLQHSWQQHLPVLYTPHTALQSYFVILGQSSHRHTDTQILSYSLQFGVWIAYALVAYCYFGVGFAGYHAFGSKTGSQIMYSLGHPIWVICVAEIMIIIHVCGSFQVWHPCD